jgi:formamidopyrimidine-DNA glycosylase
MPEGPEVRRYADALASALDVEVVVSISARTRECGDTVRQLRQVTREDEEGDKTRIIYFCPTCQGTAVDLKPPRRRRPARSSPGKEVVHGAD